MNDNMVKIFKFRFNKIYMIKRLIIILKNHIRMSKNIEIN